MNNSGFKEDTSYDNTTHSKIIRSGKITETIFANPSETPSMMVAELKSKEDISKDEELAFYKKYEALGFEYVDGSPKVEECNGEYAVLIMVKENIKKMFDMLDIINAIQP